MLCCCNKICNDMFHMILILKGSGSALFSFMAVSDQPKLGFFIRAHNCQNEKVNSLHVLARKFIG